MATMRYCRDCELYECCLRSPLGGCQEFDNVAPNPTKPITTEEVWKNLFEQVGWDWGWEKFRREAAKEILCAMIQAGVDDAWRNVVPAAIEGADELIRQLRLKVVKDDKIESL